MSEKRRILEAIRMRMRRNGVTYATLAKILNISEVSVKRYFSEERLSLDTLDDICRALSVSLDELLSDLKSVAGEQRDTFTAEQEEALSRDELLFVVFFLVARGNGFEDILTKMSSLTNAQLVATLRQLETLGLVEYQTNDTLKTLVSCNARISPGGSLWAKYSSVSINEFFKSDFQRTNEYFKLSIGYVSEENARLLKRKLENLEDEIKSILSVEQLALKNRNGRKFYWIACGFRPMESSVLQTIAEKSKHLSNEKKRISSESQKNK